MISAYRLVKTKWADCAFDGEGAKRFGGRWNSKGMPCVYVSSSESLAMLEVLVHLQNRSALEHYTLYQLTIKPSLLMTVASEDLPNNWMEHPAPSETARFGDGWLKSRASLALELPSTIVPREKNYLVNIAHPNFNDFVGTACELNFSFDHRLVWDK